MQYENEILSLKSERDRYKKAQEILNNKCNNNAIAYASLYKMMDSNLTARVYKSLDGDFYIVFEPDNSKPIKLVKCDKEYTDIKPMSVTTYELLYSIEDYGAFIINNKYIFITIENFAFNPLTLSFNILKYFLQGKRSRRVGKKLNANSIILLYNEAKDKKHEDINLMLLNGSLYSLKYGSIYSKSIDEEKPKFDGHIAVLLLHNYSLLVIHDDKIYLITLNTDEDNKRKLIYGIHGDLYIKKHSENLIQICNALINTKTHKLYAVKNFGFWGIPDLRMSGRFIIYNTTTWSGYYTDYVMAVYDTETDICYYVDADEKRMISPNNNVMIDAEYKNDTDSKDTVYWNENYFLLDECEDYIDSNYTCREIQMDEFMTYIESYKI